MKKRTHEHPGTIRMVDLSRGTTRDKPIDEVPEEQRFVYLKDGAATQDPNEATEVVPVVLVEMMAVDKSGKLVPPEKANKIFIREFGPDRRPLRSTTMVPERPQAPG